MSTACYISEARIPLSVVPLLQHAVETYASETNKTSAVWEAFSDSDLGWRPAEKSMTIEEVMKHHILSERRFFGDFLGSVEQTAAEVVAGASTVAEFRARMVQLAVPRLAYLAGRDETWWLGRVSFFDVDRERIWILWRRVLHSAHHRTQLTVYLRLLGKPVVPVYGPTADSR
ncbi:MAG: DinB family protein [Bryobacterales bacterium]|nr:DinB family protein [Bryobacterales bacterium]